MPHHPENLSPMGLGQKVPACAYVCLTVGLHVQVNACVRLGSAGGENVQKRECVLC